MSHLLVPVVGSKSADPLPADLSMARMIGEALTSFYPGHYWAVHVSHADGVAMIMNPVMAADNPHIEKGRGGYVLKLAELETAGLAKTIMRAAGEMLERWDAPRKGLVIQ